MNLFSIRYNASKILLFLRILLKKKMVRGEGISSMMYRKMGNYNTLVYFWIGEIFEKI